MFFRKKHSTSRSGAIGPVPWDDATCEKLAGLDRLNVMLTSITRTVMSGTYRGKDDIAPQPLSFEAHGIMTYPKYIVVDFQFSEDRGGLFGGFSYDIFDPLGRQESEPRVPLMHVWLSDPKIAVDMYEAHRCALMSGRRYSLVRVWKRKGEGLMTTLDKEHGYSYQSRYEVFGVLTWCTLEARNVPEWALPTAHENFSIRNLPENRQMEMEFSI